MLRSSKTVIRNITSRPLRISIQSTSTTNSNTIMRLPTLPLLMTFQASAVRAFSMSMSSMPPLSAGTGGKGQHIQSHIPLAQKAMKYFDSSPDPFHAVQTSVDMLEEAGFVQLDTDAPYKNQLKAGGKYYFTKNKSTLVAFAIGNEYTPGNGGFKIIGGHTDSPNLKIKPRSKLSGPNGVGSTGCIQLRVECYGGGLWNTWFDRDLGLSGRVFVRDEKSGKIEQKLVLMDRALLRIPNLAIHLQDAKEREAFKANKEDHLVPILSMAVKDALTGGSGESDKEEDDSSKKDTIEDDGWTEYQEPILMDMLASELNVDKKHIIDFEMNLFDVQKASLGGAYSEFVHSARLDNLASCFMAVEVRTLFVLYLKQFCMIPCTKEEVFNEAKKIYECELRTCVFSALHGQDFTLM